MRTQPSKPTSQRFPLAAPLIVMAALVGLFAAWTVPQFTGVPEGGEAYFMSRQLQAIRSQIELHRVQNAKTPYDETTPGGPAFWDPLVRGNFLLGPR
ncbi:MAG: hypothetical protein ACYSUF_11185 [Planctomycetota bacterium]|jgi:hypothetical protein